MTFKKHHRETSLVLFKVVVTFDYFKQQGKKRTLYACYKSKIFLHTIRYCPQCKCSTSIIGTFDWLRSQASPSLSYKTILLA